MLRKSLALLVLFNCALFPVAEAHPRKEAEIDISFNVNSGHTELVHRYLIADAETAIQEAYEPGLSLLNSPEAQAAFGAYVEDNVSLIHDGQPVALELVGGEIRDGYVWIYQEADPLPEDGIYVIRNSVLMNAIPEQINFIYLQIGVEPQTLMLSVASPWAVFTLDGESAY